MRNWQHKVHKTEDKYMLENIEGAIKRGKSKNWQQDEKKTPTKTQHNMCWTPLYANKTCTLLQTKQKHNTICVRQLSIENKWYFN